VSEQRLYLLRTYKYEKKDGLMMRSKRRTNTATLTDDEKDYGSDWQIWQVARAATAAPMYFKELPEKRHMREGETMVYFSDGGFGQTNNPTYEGIAEIRSLHGDGNLGAVVNIGTSRSKLKAGGKSIIKRAKVGFHIATDPKAVAEKMNALNLDDYWRFNDEDGIDVDLDDWKPNGYFTKHPGTKTLEKIKNKFREWALEPENSEHLRSCAEELVIRRRARTRDLAKWRIYATNATFSCTYAECHVGSFEDHETLENHFRNNHFVPESEMRAKVDRATKMWQYQIPPDQTH
jgi:hypothetical protein